MEDITPPEAFSKDEAKPEKKVPSLEVVYEAVQAVASKVEVISKNCELEESQKHKVAEATDRLLAAADEVRRVSESVKKSVQPLTRHHQLNSVVAFTALAVAVLHVVLSGRFYELLVLPVAAGLGILSRFIWRV